MSCFPFSFLIFVWDAGEFAGVALAARADMGSPVTATSPAVLTRNLRREMSMLAPFSFPTVTYGTMIFLSVWVGHYRFAACGRIRPWPIFVLLGRAVIEMGILELSHFDRIDAKSLIVGGPGRRPKMAILVARHDCAFQEDQKWTETL